MHLELLFFKIRLCIVNSQFPSQVSGIKLIQHALILRHGMFTLDSISHCIKKTNVIKYFEEEISELIQLREVKFYHLMTLFS